MLIRYCSYNVAGLRALTVKCWKRFNQSYFYYDNGGDNDTAEREGRERGKGADGGRRGNVVL
jgi:hypothetical protein